MHRISLIAGMLVICAATATYAATYEWTDAAGVLHFTDNPDSIPARYRDRVKERESIRGEPPAAGQDGSVNVTPPPGTPPVAATPTEYGGHDETWWRGRFGGLHRLIKGLEDGLVAKRARLEELRRKRALYQRGSDRAAYYALMKEIDGDEATVKESQKSLDDLNDEASREGVPAEWRK